jgi:hypothetical protein
MNMPDENEQNKERSKISMRIGEVQVELEGTYDNIKKLMGKELSDFTKGLQETTKQLPSSTEIAPKVTPKAPEITPKEKTVPPPARPSTTSKALPQSSRVPTIGKTSKKKIVSRRAAIALLMVCIVLSAGLVGVIAVYLPRVSSLESQIAEKDNELSSLNSQNLALQNTLEQTANDIAGLEETVEELEETVEGLNAALLDYRDIIFLVKSDLLLSGPITQNASDYTGIFKDILQYAGYVTVEAQSTSNTTYARVNYTSYGVNYNNNVTLGTNAATSFPVLPGEIEIIVGNTDTYIGDSVNATVTVTYYY